MARRRKKEFTFRGKKMEELKKLEIREFSKFLKSRERRTVLRNFDKIEKFIEKCEEQEEKGKPIRTHSGEIVIVPQLVGYTINLHNGKEFSKIKVRKEMLGHRLGEFITTRRDVEHGAPGIGATRSSAALSVK